MKFKRFIAFFSIAVLVGLYLATFISSIFTSAAAPGLFKASVFATFIVPIYMYVYLLFYKHSRQRADDNKEKLEKAIRESQSQPDSGKSNDISQNTAINSDNNTDTNTDADR